MFARSVPLVLFSQVIIFPKVAARSIMAEGEKSDTYLLLKDLVLVKDALWEARTKWYDIGLELEIVPTDLEAIAEESGSNIEVCFRKMLYIWLSKSCAKKRCTWKAIISVLRSKVIHLESLADQIETGKYSHLSDDPDIPGSTEDTAGKNIPTASESLKVVDKEYLNDVHLSPPKYVCGCVHQKCKRTFHCRNLVSSARFKAVNIKDIEGLEKEQKNDLNRELRLETETLIYAFYELLSSFCNSLEKQKIPIKRLKTYLMVIKAVPASDTDEEPALRNCKDLLKTADDIDDIIEIIEHRSSFFDYKLVEYMIHKSGTASDKEKLQEYESKFLTYLGHRVCECPLSIRESLGDDYVDLIIKLDSSYEQRKLSSIKDLEVRLSRTLKVHTCLLNLRSIERGCIKLTFQIPYFLLETIFPLSTEQERTLTVEGIILLICENFSFPKQQNHHTQSNEVSNNDSDSSSDDSSDGSDSLLLVEGSSVAQESVYQTNQKKGDIDSAIGTSIKTTSRHHVAASNVSTEEILDEYFLPTERSSQSSQNDALFIAAYTGNLIEVKRCIEEDELDPSAVNRQGNTPIHYAAGGGRLDILKYFFEEVGCSDSIQGHLEQTPLHIAAHYSKLEVVEYLINRHVDPSEIDQLQRTSLHYACIGGDLNVIKFILEEMAKFHPTDKNYRQYLVLESTTAGNTCLHLAAQNGHVEVIKYFIVNLQCDVNHRGNRRRTILHDAAKKGHVEVVKYLTNCPKCNIMCVDDQKQTALHLAAANGHVAIVEVLTNQPLYIPSLPGKKLKTPLHMAAQYGHMEVAKYLVKEKNATRMFITVNGEIPAELASRKGHMELAAYLHISWLNSTAVHGTKSEMEWYISTHKFDPTTISGCITPVHTAAANNRLDMIEYLTLEKHCDPSIKDEDNNTPLHIATVKGHLRIVKYFIEKCRCDANITGWQYSKQTPLHLAALYGHLSIASYLINEAKCNVACVNIAHRTPLHLACINGHLNVVKLLVNNANCDLNCKDSFSATPIICAVEGEHMDVIEYLMKRGNQMDITVMNKALCLAIDYKHYAVARYFADVFLSSGDILMPLKYAIENSKLDMLKYMCDELGFNPLLCPSLLQRALEYGGDLNVVTYLISKGCDAKAKDSMGRTPLHIASQEGNTAVCKYLIQEQGCDPSCCDLNDVTPLHIASERGYLDIVQYLITEQKCDANCKTNHGTTPLHLAATTSKVQVIKFLVEQARSDPSCTNKQKLTPLHQAAKFGPLELVKYFTLSVGCSVTCTDSSDCTPLHYSIIYNQLDIVHFFLTELECDVNTPDSEGPTPIDLAVYNDNISIIKYLLDHYDYQTQLKSRLGNILIVAAIQGNLASMKYLCEERHFNPQYAVGEDNSSLLHYAAAKGHTHIIKYLTQQMCCDPMCRDSVQGTPIHGAARHGHIVTLKWLINELNCDPSCCDAENVTPLMYAAKHGHLNIVQFLAEDKQCDVQCKDIDNRTPLHAAAQQGQLKVVRYLIEKQNCNPMCLEIDQRTPLHYAAGKGHLNVTEYLTLQCIPPCHSMCVDTFKEIPLHRAAAGGHLSVVKYLIDNQHSDPEYRDYLGKTTLHHAAIEGMLHIVKYLILNKGCDVDCRTDEGSTPLHLAADYGHIDTVRWLIEDFKCSPTVRDINGRTPLHRAASGGRITVIKYLIDHLRCDPVIRDNLGATSLHYAALHGFMDIIKYFILEKNCDAMCTDERGMTPLHLSTIQGHLTVFKCMVEDHGCNPFALNSAYVSPAHIALKYKHRDITIYISNWLRRLIHGFHQHN